MKQNEDETKMGALDALDKIKKAEEEARELINEAKEHTSLQIIQDAQEEAQKIKKEIINGARNKVQSIREDLIKKGELEAARIREQTQKEAEKLRKTSENLFPEAEKKVSKEIEGFLKRGVL